MASRVDKNYRVLFVNVKSAELKTKHKGKAYAYVYVNPDGRLRTKMNSTAGSLWDDRFVFSISDHSFCSQGASVFFEIYRARLGFGDSLIGIALCNVKSSLCGGLVIENMVKLEEEDKGREDKDRVYDTEEEEQQQDDHDGGDPRYPNMFGEAKDGEVKGKGKGKERGMALASLDVVKGSEKEGVLTVELDVGHIISCVGKFQWRNMAMPYEEFMGDQRKANEEKKKKKSKIRSWTCFVSAATS